MRQRTIYSILRLWCVVNRLNKIQTILPIIVRLVLTNFFLIVLENKLYLIKNIDNSLMNFLLVYKVYCPLISFFITFASLPVRSFFRLATFVRDHTHITQSDLSFLCSVAFSKLKFIVSRRHKPNYDFL